MSMHCPVITTGTMGLRPLFGCFASTSEISVLCKPARHGVTLRSDCSTTCGSGESTFNFSLTLMVLRCDIFDTMLLSLTRGPRHHVHGRAFLDRGRCRARPSA